MSSGGDPAVVALTSGVLDALFPADVPPVVVEFARIPWVRRRNSSNAAISVAALRRSVSRASSAESNWSFHVSIEMSITGSVTIDGNCPPKGSAAVNEMCSPVRIHVVFDIWDPKPQGEGIRLEIENIGLPPDILE
jgi:hypothetical protein